MFTNIKKKNKKHDSEEKPFWISFSDLMTALMTLFLTIMAVTIVLISKAPSEEQQKKKQNKETNDRIVKMIEDIKSRNLSDFSDVSYNVDSKSINLGPKAQFSEGDSSITSEKKVFFRKYLIELLKILATDDGRKNIKKIFIEGFTDRTGTYFKNLNLSLDRSHALFCAIFDKDGGENILTSDERLLVRNKFSMGGYSYNNQKKSREESRRVELRLEFIEFDEGSQNENVGDANVESNDFDNCNDRYIVRKVKK